MQKSAGWKRRAWVVFGAFLLSTSALFWLVLIAFMVAVPKATIWLIITGVVVSALPIGLGFYCLRYSTNSPTIKNISNAFIYLLAFVPLAITNLLGSGRNNWFRAGVILLFISTLVWLFLIFIIAVAEPEDQGAMLIVGVSLTAMPIGLGIYGVLQGKRRTVSQRIPVLSGQGFSASAQSRTTIGEKARSELAFETEGLAAYIKMPRQRRKANVLKQKMIF